MSDNASQVNVFTNPKPSTKEDNKIDQFKKYRIIIPVLFVVSVLLGVGGYFYYRNTTLQTLQQQEDTFASIPSGLEITPTSGNWNIPQKLNVKNISNGQKTVTWFLDCWDQQVCQDIVGQNVLQPGESFEQGLGYICSKWQLDLTTNSVNPPWNSPDDIPDNFQWEWGGTSEKKNDCSQSPSPSPTPSTPSPSSTRSPSPTPTRSSSPTATATPSPTPSATPPIGGPSETPTSTPSPTPSESSSPTSTPQPSSTSTSTPGPTNSPSEVANASTTPGATNPPTQVANAEQLPKAGVEDYASYIIAIGLFSVVISVFFAKLKKKLY